MLDVDHDISGKTILIVQGSLIVASELEQAFRKRGARVYLTGNLVSAFNLLQRIEFDGAVVDQSLHNVAYELCDELRDLGVPYICCAVPHKLAVAAARWRDAEQTVWRLSQTISGRARFSTCAHTKVAEVNGRIHAVSA
jgi:hypothetical protein